MSKTYANPLAPPPFERGELIDMKYEQWYQTAQMPAPNVSPMQRQSLAQPFLRHRANISIRTKLGKPYYGLRPDYPYFMGRKVLNTAPPVQIRPVPNVQKRSFFTPGNASPGAMGPSARFPKALPYPIVPFAPPTY